MVSGEISRVLEPSTDRRSFNTEHSEGSNFGSHAPRTGQSEFFNTITSTAVVRAFRQCLIDVVQASSLKNTTVKVEEIHWKIGVRPLGRRLEAGSDQMCLEKLDGPRVGRPMSRRESLRSALRGKSLCTPKWWPTSATTWIGGSKTKKHAFT